VKVGVEIILDDWEVECIQKREALILAFNSIKESTSAIFAAEQSKNTATKEPKIKKQYI
jgi:hypothetical protein